MLTNQCSTLPLPLPLSLPMWSQSISGVGMASTQNSGPSWGLGCKDGKEFPPGGVVQHEVSEGKQD